MAGVDEKAAVLHTAMTEAFIASLESGAADPMGWQPPWHTGLQGAVNAATGRAYNGGNALWLALLIASGGAAGPFATYRQWQGLGGQVRKGSKGITILAPRTGKARAKDGEEERTFTYFRTATVFGADAVDGWEPPAAAVPVDTAVPEADAFIAGLERVAVVRWGAGSAFYVPRTDVIGLPARDSFASHAGLYSTVFHEAGHWTGHSTRLDREQGGAFGSAAYAREELVAEFTSAFVGAAVGVATTLRQDHADYLSHWLRVVREDHSAVWTASREASRAAAFLRDAVAAGGAEPPPA